MKVLVVENNSQIRQQLCDLLEKEGFSTIQTKNGEQALVAYEEQSPDFICLDIMMPGISGHDVCRKIRKTDDKTPIIFISQKSEVIDKVIGLELGADDYIVKPFDIHEVIARVRAVARRCLAIAEPEKKDDCFSMLDLSVYPNQLKAKRGSLDINLSLRDIKILRLFHDNKNDVLDRDTLLDHCWGAHIMPESRTVDWHISQLRKRIEKDPKTPKIIQTVHGGGYKFEDPGD